MAPRHLFDVECRELPALRVPIAERAVGNSLVPCTCPALLAVFVAMGPVEVLVAGVVGALGDQRLAVGGPALVRTVEPVVVKPEADSKIASTGLGSTPGTQ